MTFKDFLILVLIGLVAWMLVTNPPDMQRSSQPLVRATAVYSIDTSARATVIINTPQWLTATSYPTATPTATETAVPSLTLTSEGTPEPQRGEVGNERGCASYRSCEP